MGLAPKASLDDFCSLRSAVNRFTSFVKMRDTDIEFIHQSARDYLARKNKQSVFESYENYGHCEVTLYFLSPLSQRLKVNLVHLLRI